MNQFAKLAAVALLFCLMSSTVAFGQKSDHQWKCPKDSRCLEFLGADNVSTNITISNDAEEILQNHNIVLRNNGTKLIWLTTTCKNNEGDCADVDLTGRRRDMIVPKNDLNETVTISKAGDDSVKISYTEFGGNSGYYFIKNGKTVGMTRIPRRPKSGTLPTLAKPTIYL